LRAIRDVAVEVLGAILPVALTVAVLLVAVFRLPWDLLIQFSVGALLVMAGLFLFLLGVKVGILPMGQAIGSELPKHTSIFFVLAAAFLVGFAVTVAEPDLLVLSKQVHLAAGGDISRSLLVYVVAIGIGFFVSTAMLRIVLGVPIAYLLTGGYIIVLVLSFLTPPEFVAVSFDAGGVTTGPVTVPVILALGIGFSSVLAGRRPITDGFGLIGLASIGPIIGVMLMGVILY
jgi:hypothetical protein